MQSLTIPDGVTSIGEGAFYGCGSLIGITIPNGVTSIGDFAFNGCTKLQKATLPAELKSTLKYDVNEWDILN